MSVITMAFSAGVLWTGLNQNTKDIAVLQGKSDGQATQLARIDANVSYLADRAREDREAQERRR